MANTADMEGFRRIQRLSYESVTHVASVIQPGWTEKQAADLIGQYLRDCGVKAFFHEPYAWFGDRTRFDGIRRKTYSDFHPTLRRLKETDVMILDVAPILSGYTGDIGYTHSLAPNPALTQVKKFLLKLRKEIPALFSAPSCQGHLVWKKVEDKITQAGFDNIHKLYPFHVLGHRLRRVPLPSFSLRTPARFSLHSFYSVLGHGLFSELLGPSHKGDLKGLWAIEPHIGAKGFGAKFEEILVIDDDGAHWLDDKVPHVEEKP